MIATLSLLSLLVGAVLACASTRPDMATEACELWSGRFLLAGLTLVGAG